MLTIHSSTIPQQTVPAVAASGAMAAVLAAVTVAHISETVQAQRDPVTEGTDSQDSNGPLSSQKVIQE